MSTLLSATSVQEGKANPLPNLPVPPTPSPKTLGQAR